MFGGMYTVATATEALQAQQEAVALNLSHLSTPGYRRQVMSFASLLPNLIEDSSSQPLNTETRRTQTSVDFSTGPLQRTTRSLDFALDGDGFFELATSQGPRYTRNGVFYLSQDNELVTAAGIPVAGANGPLRMPPNTTPDRITVTKTGAIQVDGNEVGQLKVVAFEDNHQLELDGAAIFKASAAAVSAPATALVEQGHRELSNVSATHELIRLITGVRHHDAAQRAIRSMSEAIEQRTQSQ